MWIAGSSSQNQVTNYGSLGISSTSNIPGGRDGFAVAVDAENDLFYVFGGYGLDSTPISGKLNLS